MEISSGKGIKFWEDKLLNEMTLMETYPKLYANSNMKK